MPPTPTGELQTLLTSAASAPLNDRAFLRITGPDASRWLNGMVTNNIQALHSGEGNDNFLLNAQGRIQGTCTIYREPYAAQEPSFLLETDASQLDTIHQLLDKFIIMDDVELTPLSYQSSLLLLGPGISKLIPPLGDTLAPEALEPLRLYEFHSAPATTPAPGLVPQLRLAFASISNLHPTMESAKAARATPISPETLEQLRILEARPRYATDIRNTDTAKDLPQETNQTHALHFAKGCYVGQEIVERIRSRGQVHRLFTPFHLEGTLPTTLPAPLEANGKPAGELTSAITLPTTEGPIHLALGYARREFLEIHTPLTYPGGTAHARSPGQLT